MSLVDKIEKRAKELDRALNQGFEYNYAGYMEIIGYDLRKVDDRELLEQAANRIRHLEINEGYRDADAKLKRHLIG